MKGMMTTMWSENTRWPRLPKKSGQGLLGGGGGRGGGGGGGGGGAIEGGEGGGKPTERDCHDHAIILAFVKKEDQRNVNPDQLEL